ncbi:MAG: DUF4280 domain-containing protein [Acidimicrobiales bacterium]
MPKLVVSGATIACTMGTTPSTLTVPPVKRTNVGGAPGAVVPDNVPMANVAPFGMCTTPSNPQVAAATSAASGVLTPQPCIPVTTAPWAPGAGTVLIGGTPAVNDVCTCMCTWGGLISITNPGQVTVDGT